MIELLKLIPTAGHVEALVTLFSRITDLENHRQYDLLLKAASADDATEAELAQLVRKDRDEVLRRQKEEREENYMIYRERIGFANIFNPFATDLRYGRTPRCFSRSRRCTRVWRRLLLLLLPLPFQ